MVFVTGATGLLGSHLLYHLAKAGKQITALKRPESRIEESLHVFESREDGADLWHAITWKEGDIMQPDSYEEQVRESESVYHCAAVVSFTGTDCNRLWSTNLQGSENIASLCLRHQTRLCYVSSIAALGDASFPGESIDEETPVIAGSAHSVYSHSKGDAEKIIWEYIRKGLNAVIVNPSIILGGGMWGRSSTKLFLTAVKGMVVYTNGVCGYVDVRDVCDAMIRLTEDTAIRGERFVVNGGNHSYRELFTAITTAAGKRAPFFHITPWMTGVVWRTLSVVAFLTRKPPVFTRETARSSHHKSFYSSKKLLRQLPDFHFHSLSETVQSIYTDYEKQMKDRNR